MEELKIHEKKRDSRDFGGESWKIVQNILQTRTQYSDIVKNIVTDSQKQKLIYTNFFIPKDSKEKL